MDLKRLPAVLILGMALLAAADSVCADTITNLSAVADTALFEPKPANNLGGLRDFPVGLTADVHGPPLRCRGLVKFDLTQLPTNALITSAEVTVQVIRHSALNTGSIVGLHRLLVDWGEGTGSGNSEGVPATPGAASWLNRFHPSTAWALPGGAAGLDYVATFSTTNLVEGLGTFVFRSSAGLLSDVQAWVNHPETNFGWMLRDLVETTVGSGRRVASRESIDGSGPKLTIQYLLPAGPTPFSLSEGRLVGDQFHFSFEAESNNTYTVEVLDSQGAGSWRTFTNIPKQAVTSSIDISDSVSQDSAFYRVRTP
jgi:hypothetical protein